MKYEEIVTAIQIICPSCNATMPFSFHCLTCHGAGAIEKAVALGLKRTKPFPRSKVVLEGNPTGVGRFRDMWADNAAAKAPERSDGRS